MALTTSIVFKLFENQNPMKMKQVTKKQIPAEQLLQWLTLGIQHLWRLFYTLTTGISIQEKISPQGKVPLYLYLVMFD